MKTQIIGANCMSCWAGYSNYKSKLPRKKKKLLKKVIKYIPEIQDMLPLCRCSTHTYWKKAKKWIPHIYFLNKNEEVITTFLNNAKDYLEPMSFDVINNQLSLVWHWEGYNGLYCTAGVMPAIWDKEKEDDTWSYSETMSLLNQLELDGKNIKSFKELINNLEIKN